MLHPSDQNRTCWIDPRGLAALLRLLESFPASVIRPALQKAEIEWCGYYACRRGTSSKITSARIPKNPDSFATMRS
jgi:hypothetical protein